MSSELRGSRIFHRYHRAQRHLEENRHREGDANGVFLSPTRRTAYPSSAKSQSVPNDKTVEDLTLAYQHETPGHRLATERNPMEYEPSPASARSFRIISLDGCYEEQVSPLFTDSSSSTSSYQLRGVPMIPAHPRVAARKKDSNSKRSRKKTIEKSSATAANDDVCSDQKKYETTITRPTPMRRRRSSHNRSKFVFDGNLSFGTLTPSSTISYSSPSRASYHDTMRMNYPPAITPMAVAPITPITSMSMTPTIPPHTFDSNGSPRFGEQQKRQGRRTPPPSHQEQRRRNRAMPSAQYEHLVLTPLRQEFQRNRVKHIQRQNTW